MVQYLEHNRYGKGENLWKRASRNGLTHVGHRITIRRKKMECQRMILKKGLLHYSHAKKKAADATPAATAASVGTAKLLKPRKRYLGLHHLRYCWNLMKACRID